MKMEVGGEDGRERWGSDLRGFTKNNGSSTLSFAQTKHLFNALAKTGSRLYPLEANDIIHFKRGLTILIGAFQLPQIVNPRLNCIVPFASTWTTSSERVLE